MAKKTIRAINARFKTGRFSSADFYNWITSWQETGKHYQTRENRTGRTMAGNGIYRTAVKEICAAAGIPEKALSKKFVVESGTFGKISAYMDFSLFYNSKRGGIWWAIRYDGPAGEYCYFTEEATDRKKWADIGPDDARRITYKYLCPPGFFRGVQLARGWTPEQVKATRRELLRQRRILGLSGGPNFKQASATRKSIERHRRKCPRYFAAEAYAEKIEDLLFSEHDQDLENIILSL